ncbi:P-loop NTPase [Streptomyces werraensis]|uniref:P-loop NTPase n=1 Tax=Streptomyces werraensis TaxID=68284 RepID=UPI0036965EC1
MPDGDTSEHFLCLGPLPMEEAARQAVSVAVLDDVVRLHSAGRQLTGILVLGTAGVRTPVEELVFQVQLACVDLGYEPFVVPIPGSGDLRLPATRLLARSLTEDWARTAPELWAEELMEDVIAPLETNVFPDITAWHAETVRAIDGWHPGLLPGDGSLKVEVGGRALGLVSVNTVFRMVAEDADPALLGCFREQLDLAVGGDFAVWAEGNALTLVAAGQSGEWPELPLATAPLVRLAGSGVSHAGWVLPAGDAVRHRLLRAEFGGRRVVVKDASDGQTISTAIRPGGAVRGRPQLRVVQPAEESYDEKPLLDAFHQNLSTGRMVLVLVSGPETGPPIDLDELNYRLTEAVFGAVPSPSAPPLRETWAAAQSQLTGEQRAQFLHELCVLDGEVPANVHRLMRAPWSRIYDFTGSDLLKLAQSADTTDRISLVNACEEPPTGQREVLEVIAMHGLPQEEISQNFGDPEDESPRDARRQWFRRFRAELLERPVLFVALSPNSPALWDTLRMAGRHSGEHEYPGFLVAPEGTATDRARLRQTRLQHIRTAPSGFVSRQLAPGNQSLALGKRLLAQERAGALRDVGVQRVAQLVQDAPPGHSSFLEGRDPTWGDIKDKKISAQLSLIDAISTRTQPSVEGRMPVVLVKGSAGSGKTTALMQLAYQLHRKGSHVGWVDRAANLTSGAVAAQTRQQNLDAIFVDDVNIFTRSASDLMHSLNEDGKRLVVAAIRVTRQSEIPAGFPAEIVDFDRPLTNGDLKNLVKALQKNALIGDLKNYRSMQAKVDRLRALSEKGLLAAMIEAVTGSTLREKVASEYEDLSKYGQVYQWAYAAVCIVNSDDIFRHIGISSTGLLEVVSYPDPPDRSHREAIKGLQEMGLLVAMSGGLLRCRQRTIADTVVHTVLTKRLNELETVMTKLLVSYAERACHSEDDQHPDRRAMIRLLSHNVMREFGLPPEAARRTYHAAHELLQDDRHYWLQRAEFEIDQGRFDLARNYLAAGRGCRYGQDDRLLRTADARVRLRDSVAHPNDVRRLQDAVTAVQELHDVVRGPEGRKAPHAFVALARDGASWLLHCGQALGHQQYVDLLKQITDDVSYGKVCCAGRNEVKTAAAVFDRKRGRLQDRVPGFPI